MKVALIGGSGFVGTRLIDLLQQDSNEILNIDKNQSHFFSKITTIGGTVDQIVKRYRCRCFVGCRASGRCNPDNKVL